MAVARPRLLRGVLVVLMLGEHPPFTSEEIAYLRGSIAADWHQVHQEKNAVEDRRARDELTKRLQWLEQLGEKVGQL